MYKKSFELTRLSTSIKSKLYQTARKTNMNLNRVTTHLIFDFYLEVWAKILYKDTGLRLTYKDTSLITLCIVILGINIPKK